MFRRWSVKVSLVASLLGLFLTACSAPSSFAGSSFQSGTQPVAKPPQSGGASTAGGATVTLASLTANNTAACPSGGTLPAWCQHAFTGQTDTRIGVATPEFDRPAGNVSTEDLHSYLADGTKTKIFANFMLGYCTNSTSGYCNSNVQTGYTSDDPNTIAAQAADLLSRHIDGAVMTWEGAGTSEDKASLLFQSTADQYACTSSGCNLSYILMYDGPSVAYSVLSTGIPGTTGQSCAGYTGATYENCVIAHMRNDMCYMNGKHWGNPAYQKLNGRPILQVFPDEGVIPATGPAPSWTDVWVHIESWNSNLPQNCGSAPYNANNGVPLIVFENAGGFTHQDTSGSFYWVQPAGTDPTTDQFITNVAPQGVAATLDTFLSDSLSYSGDLVWSGAYKGFNSSQAAWGAGRIMDQQCGTTWINSLTESNLYYSYGLPYLEIATWNDYNEGTEIETGIDNCYSVSAGVSHASLNWQLNSLNYDASLSTVSHIEIYDSPDGVNLTLLASEPAAANGAYSLKNLASGSHTLFVRMVGKNSILNRISEGISYHN
jgi:hypothetical protein